MKSTTQSMHLRTCDVIVFCSQNGVQFFLDRLSQLGKDVRELAGVQIAVVGSKTAQSLREYQLRADILPTDFRCRVTRRRAGSCMRRANGS